MKMAPNERERGREREVGEDGGVARVCICVSTCLYEGESRENVRETWRNEKGYATGGRGAPRPLPLCSRERRGVRDRSLRRTLGGGPLHPSSRLASSSPLRLQRSLQAPVSPPRPPPSGLFRSSSLHLFSPCIILFSFLSSLFFVLCLSTHPSLCSHPSLFLCVPDGQIDNGTAARSGVRAFPYQQHAWDSLRRLAYFHMTPRRLQ